MKNKDRAAATKRSIPHLRPTQTTPRCSSAHEKTPCHALAPPTPSLPTARRASCVLHTAEGQGRTAPCAVPSASRRRNVSLTQSILPLLNTSPPAGNAADLPAFPVTKLCISELDRFRRYCTIRCRRYNNDAAFSKATVGIDSPFLTSEICVRPNTTMS